MIDQIIVEEFKTYLKRYQSWQDSRETDDLIRSLVQESERILKILYGLKYDTDPQENIIGFAAFMSALGSKIK